jgi:hypothetical protein
LVERVIAGEADTAAADDGGAIGAVVLNSGGDAEGVVQQQPAVGNEPQPSALPGSPGMWQTLPPVTRDVLDNEGPPGASEDAVQQESTPDEQEATPRSQGVLPSDESASKSETREVVPASNTSEPRPRPALGVGENSWGRLSSLPEQASRLESLPHDRTQAVVVLMVAVISWRTPPVPVIPRDESRRRKGTLRETAGMF